MSLSQDQIIAILKENNRSLISELTGKTGTTPGAGGGGGGISWQGINSALQGTTDSFIKLTVGTYGLNDALADTSKVVSFFGPLGGALSDLTKKIGSEAIALNDSLKQVSKSGFTFDQDLGLFASSVASARMSIPQFQALVAESGKEIAGLAGNAKNGAMAFLALNKELKETDLARQLQATGIGFEEMDKMLVMSAANRRGLDMTQATVQRSVIESALGMTTEMDNIARLTGISRQEQQKALEAQLRKNEVEISVMAMSEAERRNYEQNSAMLSKYGKTVQDVYTALSTGGIRTAEDSLKAAAIGPEFQRLAQELANTNNDNSAAGVQRRKVIQEQMDIELLRVMNDKDELRNRAILATAGGDFGKVLAETTVQQKAYATALQNIERDAKDAGISVAEQRAKIDAEFGKARKDALEGTGVTGSQTAQLINRTEALIKDASAGVARGFDGLNHQASKAVTGLEGLNKVLKPYTTEDMVNAGRNMVRGLQGNRGDSTEVPAEVQQERERRQSSSTSTPATEPMALGGPVNFGQLYTVGEQGTEFFSPKQDGEIISNQTINSMMNGLVNMQTEMRSALTNLRGNMPTAGQFQEMISSVASKPAVPQMAQVERATSSLFSGDSSSSMDANTELIRGIEGLNMRVERLIAAVEDGADKSVRAVKSRGNLIA